MERATKPVLGDLPPDCHWRPPFPDRRDRAGKGGAAAGASIPAEERLCRPSALDGWRRSDLAPADDHTKRGRTAAVGAGRRQESLVLTPAIRAWRIFDPYHLSLGTNPAPAGTLRLGRTSNHLLLTDR